MPSKIPVVSDRKFASFFDGAEPNRRHLVWGFGVRQIAAHQPGADGFQHQTHAGIRIFQALERRPIHHARICVRQQPSAVEHEFAHGGKIVERARKALLVQKFSRLRKNAFGLIAQTEQRFLASRAAPLLSEREDFIRRHEVRTGLAGILAERAVAAIVAAKSRERDENLLRESDPASLPESAKRSSGGKKVSQRSAKRETNCAVAIEWLIVNRSGEHTFDGRGQAG
jgi:hypothetical protein